MTQPGGSNSRSRPGAYAGALFERDLIQRRECIECGREIGENHEVDCPRLLFPHPTIGRPYSIVDQETAVTVRYIREGA